MTEHNLIKREDAICLLEDEKRVFLIEKDGRYMDAARMAELARKMIETARLYGNAIEQYNNKKAGI